MLFQKKALQKKAPQKKALDFCLENQSCDRRYPSNIVKLCIVNSLYSKCIFADNYA